MAEAALFSVASNLLSTIASPAFKMAYEKGLSIWEAMDELDKLKTTIQTIQAVLLDAEKKQQGSASVKDWIKRVSDVLYHADDLFDEVAKDAMLKQQIKADKLSKKVRVSVLKLNPIVSRNSIAVKVKAIRKNLLEISTDMAGFGFVCCVKEAEIHTSTGAGREKGSFVDSKDVIGRDEEKSAILEMLLNESDKANPNAPVVISIVGIGGMGKTTLAQLIYNDDQVQNNFSNRWFACISDTSDEKQVIGKIFQSICGQNYSDFTVSQLETKIRELIEGKKFLLVLDDVWDDDYSSWQHRVSLLSGGVKGNRIIVTTRSSSVAIAVDAFKIHHLGGLSEAGSWDLFKRVAFGPGKENDGRWTDVGREIVKKCANVPLAIRSIGSLLRTKTTLREWESFRDGDQFSKQSGDPVMNALKLSYEPLSSSLKHCFAYCSLFPKDFVFKVQRLIHLWIAQGYIIPDNDMQTVEQVGHSYFMDLLRRGFFQEEEEDEDGEIESCKMHDLVHDLAQMVAGEETVMVTTPSNQFKQSARHVGVGCEANESWEILAPLLDAKRVRSVVFTIEDSRFMLALDQRFTNLKCLRALSLSGLGIDIVSSNIGELKHLRYLDLSSNKFKSLPDSMAKLLNLQTLFLRDCSNLKALPDNFRKLINLRYLDINYCYELKHMPHGMGELTSLQYLSKFKVGKAIESVEASGLDALAGLKQLRGILTVEFDKNIEDWNGDEFWRLPVSPQALVLCRYPGMRVPHWADHLSLLPNLANLFLSKCRKVKYLPPLRCLPNLKYLFLSKMDELEYVDEEDSHSCTAIAGSISISFFPRLEMLVLHKCPKLKGWWKEVAATASPHPMFLSLIDLHIEDCPELKSIPLCPHLVKLKLERIVGDEVVQQLLSNKGASTSNSIAYSTSPCPSSSVEHVEIRGCNGITSFSDEALTSLRSMHIRNCHNLNNLHIASPQFKEIRIMECRQLKVLHLAHPDKFECVRWFYFPTILVDTISDLEELPDYIQELYTNGRIDINLTVLPNQARIVLKRHVIRCCT